MSSGIWPPQISELWIGQRIQLARNPNAPWDPADRSGLVVDKRHETGATTRYVLAEQAIAWSASWDLTPDDDDQDNFEAWRLQSRGGLDPFVWVYLDGVAFPLIVLAKPEYSRPFQSASWRTFTLSVSEQLPLIYPETLL